MASVETTCIVITDLVGSTGLASRVGPAAADELRREHFAVMRDAIEETGAREVKNMGDGLMVVTPSASAAVACAVAMQQRLERRNRGAEEQLVIRVGVSLGDATAEEDDYFGMPVIEAARLCDKAQGGQILATDVVKMLGGRDGHSFNPVGELELKGIPEPVATHEVAWEPAGVGQEALPLPPRLRGVPPVGYVGREEEQELAGRLWQAAGEGRRQFLLLSGEAGIGKTRFATHAALERHGEGAVVLYGRCAEDLGAPYGPWIEALGHYVEHAPQEVLDEYVSRHGGELCRLVPALSRRVPDAPSPRETDPETERYLLFGAVVRLLETASADESMVLLLDDLHWADKPSLGLLKHLAVACEAARLMTIGTFRESDLTRDHPLTDTLADLRREDGVERLALSGLDERQVAAIMEAAAGHEMDDTGLALARQIATETGGNPFFVGELLRHLSESGTLYQREDGRWELKGDLGEIGMPQSVREVVGRRVERLGEATRSALTAAAVIGRDFDVDLLLKVSERNEDELLDLLEGAVEASVLVESSDRPGSFSFSHALMNHTLYDELGATRRARLHRRVAEALEEICGEDPGPRISELAHHWSAATAPVDAGKAVEYSARAGERALAELAPDEGVRWFSNALELEEGLPEKDAGRRLDLLIGLGTAQRQAGQAEYRETLLEAGRLARELGEPDRLAAAALANTRGYTSEVGIVDEDRVETLRAAVDSLPLGDARTIRLRSLLGMELAYNTPLAVRRELSDQALEAARENGDESMLAYVLIDRFFAIWTAETAVERRALIHEELRPLVERLDDPMATFWASALDHHVSLDAGDRGGVDRGIAAAKETADKLGEPFITWFADWLIAARSTWTGQLDDAEEQIEEAVAFAMESGQGDAMIIYVAQAAALRRDQGRADELEDVLAQAVEDNPGLPGFAALLAIAHTQTGRDDEAHELLNEAAAQDFAHIGPDVTWLNAMTLFAEVAAHLREQGPAETLIELISPYGELMIWNGASFWGSASHALGQLHALLGRHAEADSHFERAAAGLEALGAPLFLARTRIEWARSLLERDEGERARELLELGAEAGRSHGSPPVEAAAGELLSAPAAQR